MSAALIQSQRGVCKSCRAPIIWAWSERGTPMPLNRAPGIDGNIELSEVELDPRTVRLIARVVGPKKDGKLRYVAHFVTCPDARKHRRAR